MRYVFGAFLLILSGCGSSSGSPSPTIANAASCKGVYYSTSPAGILSKWNQYWQDDQKACLTDPVPLSQWEKTNNAWDLNKVSCTPQPSFTSKTLISSGNYYSYRDNRVLIDFDSSTGIYRRIILAENSDGSQVFTRQKGCFYERTGVGADSVFGTQLLLDSDVSKLATSEVFDPWEIFNYSEAGNSAQLIRFDDVSDWDYTFCPESSADGFCDAAKNGNILFYSNLTAQQKIDIKIEAITVRTQFNFVAASKSDFESKWSDLNKSGKEIGRDGWKFAVNFNPDTPQYVSDAWRDYVMNKRAHMPVLGLGSNSPQCFPGSQSVTLGNGSTGKVYGEICYDPVTQTYTFTQN